MHWQDGGARRFHHVRADNTDGDGEPVEDGRSIEVLTPMHGHVVVGAVADDESKPTAQA